METISNAAAAAAKAVWGDSEAQKEPVSGVKGNTAQGEPYDAGNMDNVTQDRLEDRLDSSSNNNNNNATRTPESRDALFKSADTPATAVTDTRHHDADRGINTGASSGRDDLHNPTSIGSTGQHGLRDVGVSTDAPHDASTSTSERHDVNTTATTTTAAGQRELNDTTSAGQGDKRDTSAGQNDTRDPDDVATLSPDQLKGSGPRPVEEVAREHGGDAGQDKPGQTTGSSSNTKAADASANAASSEKPATKETHDEYVRTTGFAADGGDFDASNPGAGREADRLLEEKGVHPDHGRAGGSSDAHSHGSDKHSKPSLGERIKAKLHKH